MIYQIKTGMGRTGFGNAIFMVLIIIIILLNVSSCRQNKEERSFSNQVIDFDEEYNELTEIKEIFYDLYSPVEAHRLLQQIDLVFDPAILNPVENQYRYISSNKNAVNIGIYGADLSFCHMFGQTQEAINYMTAITRLSERLGIGGNVVIQSENLRARPTYDPDTLFNLATSIYTETDRHLKENERVGAASLIITGGWVEALYIASTFYESGNPDINLEQNILTQKYSLDRLIALLSNYQNDDMIAKYTLMLRQLKLLFDSVEIHFDQDDLLIDTASKTIVTTQPKFIYREDKMAEIVNLIKVIRNDMVN